jgi:hypothetical protein
LHNAKLAPWRIFLKSAPANRKKGFDLEFGLLSKKFSKIVATRETYAAALTNFAHCLLCSSREKSLQSATSSVTLSAVQLSLSPGNSG